MKNILSLILISLFSLGIVSAQTSFKLNPYPKSEPSNFNSTDTVRILAVMVEFQQDNDGNTFGNGKFGSIYTQDYGTDILDPLPHDANYFRNHLEFAKNYFSKVSNGVFNISYTVLPNIVTVSKIMRDYSPPARSSDFNGLGNLAEEVWGLADQSFEINFADYDLFTIFHAGVGREIPTPGSIGLDRDIPSVYLSEAAFKDIFGAAFTGFPVNGGSFSIKNTAVLPSTENREIESFGETYLQEFSINGLLVGTIASYIGLPDLFNTETGSSAIGRFGLMDGQALFAYSGLFPPEPSAWEKVYLGWITPTEVSLQDQTIDLTTYLTALPGDETLIKIPINSSEYYLIENRKRDANKDGVTITYKVGNFTNKITFDKDYPAFSPFGADTLIGVITDVDEFDWALPAFEESQTFDDAFEDVGFVIWHIDEEVIRQNIETNTINNNKDLLGVRVVEADGIFDIGEEFYNIFGETVIGEGTKQDTWYAGNPSEFYKNKFNAATKPPAVSNLGANSLISISNISAIGNTMSFDLAANESNVSLLFAKEILENPEQIISVSENIAIRNIDGSLSLKNNSGNEISTLNEFSNVDAASWSDEGMDYLFGAFDDSLKVFVTGILLPFQTTNVIKLSSVASSPVVVNNMETEFEIFIGLQSGVIEKYTYNKNNIQEPLLIQTYSAFSNQPVKQISYLNGIVSAVSVSGFWSSAGSSITLDHTIEQLSMSVDDLGVVTSIVLAGNKFYLINDGAIQNSFAVNSLNSISSFSLGDLKGDGNNYIIFNNGNKLEARNMNGASASYFPVEIPTDTTLSFTPLVLDINQDDYDDIITFSDNGNIFAIDGINAQIVYPFPISAGTGSFIQPILSNKNSTRFGFLSKQSRFGVSSNLLNLWKLSDESLSISWGGKLGSLANTASISVPKTSNVESEFFPQEAAYNWPNPVYGNETQIRFYVSENSNAEITIFDLAGDLVAKLTAQATGGMDNEVTWNVDDIQSGVYFAHVNVESNGGKTDSKLIKIAVIK